jgi:hypothetical protein
MLIFEIHLTAANLICIRYAHDLIELNIMPLIAISRLDTRKRKLVTSTVVLQQNSLHLTQSHFLVVLIF